MTAARGGSGVGIEAEQLERIWDAFNQGSEGMARRYAGALVMPRRVREFEFKSSVH